MDEIIQLVIKSYGLLGLLLIAPWIVVIFLWKDNKFIRQELVDTQQKRVQDAKELSRELLTTASADSALKKETNILLERMGDTLDRLERS